MIIQTSIEDEGRRVRVAFADGLTREFAAPWLFDHADEARDAVSGQRRQSAASLQGGVSIEAADTDADGLRLRFSRPAGERRISAGRLRSASVGDQRTAELWETPDAVAQAPTTSFHAYLLDDDALRQALGQVRRWGLAILSGAGADPSAVERAVARFGFVRETNYGRTFDVRVEAAAGNLAYTDLGLDLHTDNPYRDPPPTLQLLHAIVVDEAGGGSLFADGLAHAEALRREVPAVFERLARTPVRFAYSETSGARWSHQAPVLSVDELGAVRAVRLNHRSLDLDPGEAAATGAWYEAYLAFYRRVCSPAAIFELRLTPGDMVIFDNRRILHGRRALTRETPRWLRGCYADGDGLAATLARLDRAASQEMSNVG